MNLKEAYRYANYLDRLLDTAYIYLGTQNFVTTSKQNHMRSKANKDAVDEIIEVPKPYDVDFTPNNIIDFAVKVIAEKEALTNAITNAKSKTEINIDNAIAMNKKKHEFIAVLENLSEIRPTERTIAGKDYKFDVNGAQKPYIYDICETTVIDFNRNDVKSLIKKYTKNCDDISSRLDVIEINTQVEFEPLFDITDDFEDIVAPE